MRVCVSEFITGGALCGQPLPPSLQREGLAMRNALIGDLLNLPDVCVTTTLDARMIDLCPSPVPKRLEITVVHAADEAQPVLDNVVRRSDGVLIIAPETHGILMNQVNRAAVPHVRSLNCSHESIVLCSDKLELSQWFSKRQIPTLPTALLPDGVPPWDIFPGPCVVKPRDGAGSWLTFAISPGDTDTWTRRWQQITDEGMAARMLVQPQVAGRPMSVALVIQPGGSPEVFPVGLQRLTADDFQYCGGQIPAALSPQTRDTVAAAALRACWDLRGLAGYVGVDLILPDDPDQPPLVVEINPRLTTSYVGYRELCQDNIAARLLASGPPLRWREGSVVFTAEGTVSTL